ncbi:hypothetical protein niasHT_030627 [Heterodera trifolii]|uniref:Methyltransferase-like protein 5 n=1 Tax=Heterodera trifolii TaxID=157864 RepID=A0ABD2HTR1_9BILA
MKVRPKRFKSLLQEIDDFNNPRIELEQYITPLDISVALLQHVNDLIGLDECAVADLGCGTGMLLLGSTLLGAKFAVGVDCCQNALSVAKSNIDKFELEGSTTTSLVLADVTKFIPFIGKFDVVLTNPPFGTKNNQGTDVAFVLAGLRMLRPGGKLFSLHKSSTRNFLTKMAKNWDTVNGMECVAELKWNLEPTYKFHKKTNVDINVILCSFEKR